MNTKNYLVTMALAGAALIPGRTLASTLYSQDFEASTPVVVGPTAFGGFGQINNIGGSGWQVQGGGGGGGISVTTGIDSSGFGFSQGFFANWDHSAASGFTFNQQTIYGAVGAAGVGLAGITIEMDIFISGSSTTTPVGISLQNNGNGWVFRPTLTDGDWTHVSFTADQGTPEGVSGFNTAASSNLRIQFGAGDGFGFDAGNLVTLDNIVITAIPEPASMALLGLGAAALFVFRRSRS